MDIAASFINAGMQFLPPAHLFLHVLMFLLGLGIFFTMVLGMAYVETLDKLIRTRGNLLGLPKAERQRLIEAMFKYFPSYPLFPSPSPLPLSHLFIAYSLL